MLRTTALVLVALLAACGEGASSTTLESTPDTPSAGLVPLPPPDTSGGPALDDVLRRRRSVRSFSDAPIDEAAMSQLCWAAQGVTSADGYRTAPSAGALYPLEVYVVTVDGVARYLPSEHALEVVRTDDSRAALSRAALSQSAVEDAPAVFVITGVYERTSIKYGARAERYVHLEAGHAAQNLLLEATALGLGVVPIGAFDDDAVQRTLGIPADHRPLYLIPVGHPSD